MDIGLPSQFQTEFEPVEVTVPEINGIDEEEDDLDEVEGEGLVLEEEKKEEGVDNEEALINESGLSKEKIIELTNKERLSRGRDELEESYVLNMAAQKKARDMLDREYFAHEAPTGEEAADLVKEVDYSFLFVGENLAKGNFQDSQNLVTGWMNSPDHKENILSSNYREIGVGLKKGYFEGREVLMAVQIFGTPTSSCPDPNGHILESIDQLEEETGRLTEQIKEIDEDLDDLSGSEYNQAVEERNELAEEHNFLRERLIELIDEYNRQVDKRNTCLDNL